MKANCILIQRSLKLLKLGPFCHRNSSSFVSVPRVKREFEILKSLPESAAQFPDQSTITQDEWVKLTEFEHLTERLRFLHFLKKRQTKKLNQRQEKQNNLAANSDDERLFQTNRFLMSSGSRVRTWQNARLARAWTERGPTICLDASFIPEMNPSQQSLTWKQFGYTYLENKMHTNPCRLFFTGLLPEFPHWDDCIKRFVSQNLSPEHDDIDLVLSQRCYTELFPKDKIVYLTPDSDEILHIVDENSVYIIGGLVDKLTTKFNGATLKKASSQGIRTAQLPLDFVSWKSGGKALTLNQVLLILLDSYTLAGDWETALTRRLPGRKIMPVDALKSRLNAKRRVKLMEQKQMLIEEVCSRLEDEQESTVINNCESSLLFGLN